MKTKQKLFKSILSAGKYDFLPVHEIEAHAGISAFKFIDLPQTQAYIEAIIKAGHIESIAQLRLVTDHGVKFTPLLALKFLAHANPGIEAEIYSIAYQMNK